MVKNHRMKQREQRSLGYCWPWKANGQCSKGDNCSFRHDMNKRAKMTQPNPSPSLSCNRMRENHREPEVPEAEVPAVERLDGLARITLEELVITHFVKSGTFPNALFYKTKSGCRFGEKCSYAHRPVDEQPTKRSKKNDDKSAVAMLKKGDWHENVREPVVSHGKDHDRSGRPDKNRDHELKRGPTGRRSSNARQLGCAFQDMKPPKSILRKSSDMQKPIQRVKFAKAICTSH